MTTEAPTTPAAAPATPQVIDVQAITNQAVEAATKAASGMAEKKATEIAAKRIQEIGRAMSGDGAVNPTQTALETFVADPLKTMHSLKEITKKEIREEQQRINDYQATQRNSVQPFINDYPELNSPKKLALVEKLADQHAASGLSYADALKKGCEEAIKEFGLKSVSEAEKAGNVANVALPHGGGFRSGTPSISQEKSTSDFMTGMKSRLVSFRKRA